MEERDGTRVKEFETSVEMSVADDEEVISMAPILLGVEINDGWELCETKPNAVDLEKLMLTLRSASEV